VNTRCWLRKYIVLLRWNCDTIAEGANMKPHFTKIAVMLVSLTAISSIMSFDATAATARCGDRATLMKTLKEQYKEVPVGLGISQKSTEAFEVYASESGSWTVVMTMSNGMACVMATGHSWQNLPTKVAGSEI